MKRKILNDKLTKIGLGLVLVIILLFTAIPVSGKLDTDHIDPEAQMCLAKNIYFEARDQGTASHVAVSLVVLNRVNDKRYPNTICEVIYQGPTYSWKPEFPVRHKCQFSWYCDGKSDKPKEIEAWNEALTIASLSLGHQSYLLDFTEGSTHYHATHIKPHWADHLTRIAQIEGHIFYRLEP